MSSELPTADSPPPAIPDHDLIRRIGAGSYGEVWLARNALGAYRAVKIVYRKTFRNERPFERELSGIEKFEPLSRSHEGFIDVLHVGKNLAEGYFYYVMELGDNVSGTAVIDPLTYEPKTLSTEMVKRCRLPFDECLQLALSLSKALHHLHKNGLVHRDVKPANIIFVQGIPKLADIGLVAPIDNPQSFVGTIGFIPPEGPGTPQADIYSLGKVLYEISTGKDRQQFPELPTQLNEMGQTASFLELNEVILKACQNAVGHRYQSAQEMHAELVVLETGNSVKRLRVLEAKLQQFKKIAVIAAAAALVLLALGYHVTRERKFAAVERQRKISAHLSYGIERLDDGDFIGALPAFVDALALEEGSPQETRNHRFTLGHIMERAPRLMNLWVREGQARACRFHPLGKSAAFATWGNRAQLYNLETMQSPIPTFGEQHHVDSIAFSPDGERIATASQTEGADIWDTATGHLLQTLRHPHPMVFSAEFSPDGTRVVTAGGDGKVRLWDPMTGACVTTLTGHTGVAFHATFSHNGKLIASAGQDGTTRLWEAQTGVLLRTSRQRPEWVYRAEFNPDDTILVTATSDKQSRFLETSTLREVLSPLRHAAGIRTAIYSPDGSRIATASFDGTVRLWNARTAQPVPRNSILRHPSAVTDVCFSPDGEKLMAACNDGSIFLWDLTPTGEAFDRIELQPGAASKSLVVAHEAGLLPERSPADTVRPEAVVEFSRSRDGRFLIERHPASNSSPALLRIYNYFPGTELRGEIVCTNSLETISLSGDGKRIGLLDDRSVRIIEVASGQPVSAPLILQQNAERVYLNFDGGKLIAINNANLSAWNIKTGQPLFPSLQLESEISDIAFSPDGTLFVCSCFDNEITPRAARIFRVADGRAVGTPLRHRDGVCSASFSPDGKKVVTASEDFSAVVWDVQTGRQLTPALKQPDKILMATFNSDGRWILTAGLDGTVRVWDAATGFPLSAALKFPEALFHAAFLADSNILVWSGKQRQKHCWSKTLISDERSIEDLKLTTALLSGNQQEVSTDKKSFERIWNAFRARHGDPGHSDPEQRKNWHRAAALAAKDNDDPAALAFHLRFLPGEEKSVLR